MRMMWKATAMAGALAITATTLAAQSKMAGMEHDKDVSAGGTGVPAGYVGRTDRANANIADAKYASKNGMWDITTGPAHIVYSPKNTASGQYLITTTIEQEQAPAHPEAFGLFFGGKNLDSDAQSYSYFLVRGTGEYFIQNRNGAQLTKVVGWTPSDAIPKQDANGKATYKLAVHFAPDTVHFQVNGKLVAAVPRSQLQTDGIYGLRVNHNLHVLASPVKKE